MKRLLVTGGGTGGHVYPAVSVAQRFLAGGPGREALYLGSGRGLEARVSEQYGLPFHAIPARGFRGKSLTGRILFLTTLLRGFLAARRRLRRFGPDAVLATGSYVSLPVLLAARLEGVPVFIQEQNSVPGSANRLGARWARRIFLAFPEAARYFPEGVDKQETGNPLRPDFSGVEVPPAGVEPRLLVFGGSLGARRLCEAAAEALPRLAERHCFSAVVQTGDSCLEETESALAAMGERVEVHAYLDDMPERMAAADLVVSRAGAMTLAELTALGRPSLLVPFPLAVDDHQTRNALSLVRAGAARLIPDGEMDGARLFLELDELLGDASLRETMAAASRSLARPDAAGDIVEAMEKCLAGPSAR